MARGSSSRVNPDVRLEKTLKGASKPLVEVTSDPARIVALEFDGYVRVQPEASKASKPQSQSQS